MLRGGFQNKIGIVWMCAVSLLIFIGCVGDSAPQEVDTSLQRDIQQRASALEQVRAHITFGTPRSLDIALNTLYSNNLYTSEIGAELAFVANRFYHFVYPYLEYSSTQVQPPAGSLYPQLFEEVQNGQVPSISQENTTFLSSLASALTVLTTNSAAAREQAGEVTSYVVKINPDSMIAQFLHGYYLEKQEQYSAAQNLFQTVLRNDDSCYPARLGLVRVFYSLGKPEMAFSHVEQLLLEFPQKRYVLQWAINIHLQAGQLEKADRLLSTAIIQYPEETIFLRKRAELLELQGKYEQAGRIAAVVERRTGETPETLLIKVQSFIRNGRIEEALALSEKGMETYPSFQRFPALYGELLIQIGRRGEAYEFFRQRLEQDPDNLSIIASLLDTAIELERWNAAAGYLTQLLEVRRSTSLLMKAVTVYRALGQMNMALEYARTMAEEYPDDPGAVNTYLNVLLTTGTTGEATEYINRRLSAASNSEVRSVLLYFQARLVDDQQAKLQYLQSALLENMQNANALIEIADLYESMGEYNKAIRYLRQAIALSPDNQALQRKMRALQNRTK
jgi:tetratricopeptide (TPR) repeat protein